MRVCHYYRTRTKRPLGFSGGLLVLVKFMNRFPVLPSKGQLCLVERKGQKEERGLGGGGGGGTREGGVEWPLLIIWSPQPLSLGGV